MDQLSKLTWQELNDHYTKYIERLAQIERFLKILPEKRRMSARTGDIMDAALRANRNSYEERLYADIINISRKIRVLNNEINRRAHLIGATA